MERHALVAHPVDAVWAVLARFEDISAWAPNVDHSCLLSEGDAETGLGATRRIQTGRTTVRETITVWEPERTLAYRIDGLPPVVRAVTNTWRLDPVGVSTQVSLVTEIVPGPRPPHRVAARVVGRVLGSASDRMLSGLAVFLNGRHAAMNGVDE